MTETQADYKLLDQCFDMYPTKEGQRAFMALLSSVVPDVWVSDGGRLYCKDQSALHNFLKHHLETRDDADGYKQRVERFLERLARAPPRARSVINAIADGTVGSDCIKITERFCVNAPTQNRLAELNSYEILLACTRPKVFSSGLVHRNLREYDLRTLLQLLHIEGWPNDEPGIVYGVLMKAWMLAPEPRRCMAEGYMLAIPFIQPPQTPCPPK